MIDISAIKSEKLRELVGNSIKFESLFEEEQKNTLDHIVKLSPEEQEEFYVPFFEKENKKEEEKMQAIGSNNERAIALLTQKIDNISRNLSKWIREDLEKQDRKQDTHKQNELLEELKNL